MIRFFTKPSKQESVKNWNFSLAYFNFRTTYKYAFRIPGSSSSNALYFSFNSLNKKKRLSKILKTTDNFSFMKMHIKREWTFGNRPNIRRRGYEEELRLGFLRALNSCCCSSFGIHLKSAGEQSKLLSIICLKSACEATIIISVVFFSYSSPTKYGGRFRKMLPSSPKLGEEYI